MTTIRFLINNQHLTLVYIFSISLAMHTLNRPGWSASTYRTRTCRKKMIGDDEAQVGNKDFCTRNSLFIRASTLIVWPCVSPMFDRRNSSIIISRNEAWEKLNEWWKACLRSYCAYIVRMKTGSFQYRDRIRTFTDRAALKKNPLLQAASQALHARA